MIAARAAVLVARTAVLTARAAVLVVLAAAIAAPGCADLDTDVTTSPTAHESPPLPPPPLINIGGGRYLGGTGLDVIDDMAVGPDGNLYIVGGTASLDFPITVGPSLDTTAPADCPACPFDAFVASVAPSGALRWARLIQTPGYDRLRTIAVQGNNVWIAGSAGDGELAPPGFFRGGVDPERGTQDGVLCHLMAAGGQLTACRYVGGSGPAGVADLAVSPNGSDIVLAMTVVAGENLHLDPVYAEAFTGAHRGVSNDDDGVLLGFGADLALQWATYVGGSGAEGGTPSVLVDDEFTFYLGETTSVDAPIPGAFDTTPGAGTDAYLAAFSDDGTLLRYGSYIGGNADERVGHNALAGGRFELYVGIGTSSSDLPTAAFSNDASFNGDGGPDCGEGDVWLAHVRPISVAGTSLEATTYLGGAQGEQFGGLSLVTLGGFGGGRIAVTLRSHSPTLQTGNAAQPFFASPLCSPGSPGRTDAYVAILTSTLFAMDATYLGGNGGDGAIAVAQAPQPVPGLPIMVAGDTTSIGLAVSPEFDDTYEGAGDGFVVAYTSDFNPPFPGDAGDTFDGPGSDGSVADTDGGIPPGYDEGPSGCCGASTPAGGTLGLALATLALLRARRKRP